VPTHEPAHLPTEVGPAYCFCVGAVPDKPIERPPWIGRVLKALAGLAVVAVVGWFAVQRALGPEVAVVRPARREVVQTVVTSGRVLSPAEVSVGTMFGGVVSAVHAREGERVVAGQMLVEFDDAELTTQVAQARAGVLVAEARVGQMRTVNARVAEALVGQAEANLAAAEASQARQESLFRAGAVAAADREAAQRSLEVAREQLRSAQATSRGAGAGGGDARVVVAGRVQAAAGLRLAEARLAQARVTAPAAGVIMRRSVEPGDVVAPGRALLVLLRDGPVELSVTPDERNLADLRLGQSALASAEAFPDQHFGAVVTYLAPTVDALHGTVEVRLGVPSPPAYLRPSMTVSVEVEVARRAGALTLPPEAVRDAATPSPWVMVVDDRHAARRAVTLGLRGERVVEVVRGLRDGESVVPVRPGVAVRVGQRVRPHDAAGR